MLKYINYSIFAWLFFVVILTRVKAQNRLVFPQNSNNDHHNGSPGQTNHNIKYPASENIHYPDENHHDNDMNFATNTDRDRVSRDNERNSETYDENRDSNHISNSYTHDSSRRNPNLYDESNHESSDETSTTYRQHSEEETHRDSNMHLERNRKNNDRRSNSNEEEDDQNRSDSDDNHNDRSNKDCSGHRCIGSTSGSRRNENHNNENKCKNCKKNYKSRARDRRICDRKYAEYMTRIFTDEDDHADAQDLELDGRDLSEPGEYPHMTALGYKTTTSDIDYKCGGSLISENFVITAAHCTNISGESPTTVRIGDLDLMVEERHVQPQIRQIKRIYNHPEYNGDSYYNDIALLKLNKNVEFTQFVRPIRLWVENDIPYDTAFAMGYGATSFGKARTNRLTDLNMTIVSNEECGRLLPTLQETVRGIIDSQICAHDYAMNRDTCQGDSGGPLQLNLFGRRKRNRKHYHLIGITSYGLFCRSDYPSVYTRTSSFLDWIEQIVWA